MLEEKEVVEAEVVVEEEVEAGGPESEEPDRICRGGR
jgi:hypothetical protein